MKTTPLLLALMVVAPAGLVVAGQPPYTDESARSVDLSLAGQGTYYLHCTNGSRDVHNCFAPKVFQEKNGLPGLQTTWTSFSETFRVPPDVPLGS